MLFVVAFLAPFAVGFAFLGLLQYFGLAAPLLPAVTAHDDSDTD